MNLTKTDQESVLWMKIVKHLNERLQSYRTANDSGVLTEIETARLRGKIAEVKEFLNLPAASAPGEYQTAQALGE
jgi:hypothetical protein